MKTDVRNGYIYATWREEEKAEKIPKQGWDEIH